jgi:plasmid maintenance system antidote protein VapI
MAIRIEKAFDVPMDTLMRMQNSFAIAQPHRRKSGMAVERYVAGVKGSVAQRRRGRGAARRRGGG